MSALLLVRLKIPDLTALTALDTARALLAASGPRGNAIELTRLVREEVYLFEAASGRAAEAFEAGLAKAIDSSNFFVNPNKESFRFSGSADRGKAWAPPEGAWGILSRSRGDTRDLGLNERLQREHPLPDLGAIRRARTPRESALRSEPANGWSHGVEPRGVVPRGIRARSVGGVAAIERKETTCPSLFRTRTATR